MILSLKRKKEDNGLRPLKPSRDLRGVANLIEDAFSNELDSYDRSALREMRFKGYFGLALLWYDYFSPDINTNLNGFVWTENGKIIGNVTINRNSPYSRYWFVSNVAVAKTHRHQGIGYALMTAAIEFAHEIGGEFIVLQVHEDNAPAISLYRLFGFKRVLATTTLYMPQVKAAPHTAFPKELSIRDHNLDTHDCHAAYHLAKATIPAHVQEDKPVRQHHYMIGSELMVDNFWRWLFRLGKVKYWVMEQKDETFVATLKVTPGVWGDVHRISLMVHPKWHGKLEHPLIGLALTHLLACPKRSILFEHPAEHVAGITAFKKIGFDALQTYVIMKLML